MAAPFRPVKFDKPCVENLIREVIQKPPVRPRDIDEIIPGDLIFRVVFIVNCHTKALPCGPILTKLPSSFGLLTPPAPGSVPGRQLPLASALWAPFISRIFNPVELSPVLDESHMGQFSANSAADHLEPTDVGHSKRPQ